RGRARLFRRQGRLLMASSLPLLTVIILVPAIGALVVALMPGRRPDLVKLVGILFALATAALTVYLLIDFNRSDDGMQFVTDHIWIKEFGISWHLGVDGISLFLVVLTGVLFPLAFWGGDADASHDVKAYTAWMLLLEAGVLGTFLALDLFLFFVFFEIVLVPIYFLLRGSGHRPPVYPPPQYLPLATTGSAFLLLPLPAPP